MTNPEYREQQETSSKWPLKVEKQLINLESRMELNWLRLDILWQELEYKNLSKDWKYEVYSYTTTWTRGEIPNYIRMKTQIQLQLKSIKWIKITDRNWKEYPEFFKIETWKKVFVKVPKNEKEVWNDRETQTNSKDHRDNPDYFDSTKKVETDNTYKNKWIILKRDVWMSFYVMNTKDIQYTTVKGKNGKTVRRASRNATINHLRKKLWALKEFSYLNNSEYAPWKDDVTKTFNIRPDFAEYLKKHPNSYFIPIPLDSEKRKIGDKKFKNYAKSWIDEICKKDEPYGKYWKWIRDKSKLAAFFTAIAKVETWKTDKRIWTDEYHRRETNWHNCFSFGPHHILMEWSWKKAFNILKDKWYFSTEWQVYHPKNSTMRCMWFIVEKLRYNTKEKDIPQKIRNMLSFFNKNNVTWEDFRNFALMYNGSGYRKNNYHNKFAQAYNLVK